jgi:CHAD domain-containing protein
MVRKSKWIDGVAADLPVSDAACRALRVRLSLVWHYVPLAAEHAFEDIEHVHQLRVATRRAVATLEVFDDVLPSRRGRWMSKRLKELRRAAGDARDDDVLAERLADMLEKYPAMSAIVDRVRRHRRRAQKPIRDIYTQLYRRRLPRRIDDLIDRVRWREQDEEPSFGIAGRARLRPILSHFMACGEADLGDYAALHQLRIAGKQLRYAMEIFAAAFDEGFRRELYPQIEEAQELLGEVNDHFTARQRFEAWLAESTDAELAQALKKLAAAEARSLARSRDKFLNWWTPEQAEALRKQFAAHLNGCR